METHSHCGLLITASYFEDQELLNKKSDVVKAAAMNKLKELISLHFHQVIVDLLDEKKDSRVNVRSSFYWVSGWELAIQN